MSKFASRVKKFNITDRRAFVAMPELQHSSQGATPRIEVLSTSQSNGPYFNALLKLGTKVVRRKSTETLTVKAIKKDRLQQAKLFSQHVVVGWYDMLDDDGQPVEFTEANVMELLSALIKDAPHLFDRIRDVADNNDEFYESPDVEELVGNSESVSSGS